jgi:hypothetical protein
VIREVVPRALRRVFFVVGVGTLVASGIYLKSALSEGADLWMGLRSLMFFSSLGCFSS